MFDFAIPQIRWKVDGSAFLGIFRCLIVPFDQFLGSMFCPVIVPCQSGMNIALGTFQAAEVTPAGIVQESSYCCTVHACGEKSAWPDAIFLIDVMRAQRLRMRVVVMVAGSFAEMKRLDIQWY